MIPVPLIILPEEALGRFLQRNGSVLLLFQLLKLLGKLTNPLLQPCKFLGNGVRNVDLVERCAMEADPDLFKWIMWGVTNEDVTFNTLKALKGIPCERDTYYDRRRKFYYLLSKKLGW